MFKNKKWLVLLIVIFPSLFWVILETSTINSSRLPHYGPKKVLGVEDTLFHTIQTQFETLNDNQPELFDTIKYPVIAVMFIKDTYKNDAYRISGFWEYVNYKIEKIDKIPFVLICEKENGTSETIKNIKAMAKNAPNIFFTSWAKQSFDSINKTYFIEKPYYVDYSFFVLVDKKRQIRGYYDARYVAEIKRLISEYQHLRLKEEKKELLKNNKIDTK